MLEKMMDKLNGLEEELHQKADVKVVEDLEYRAKQLEDSAKERVSNESRVHQLEENVIRQGQSMTLRLKLELREEIVPVRIASSTLLSCGV